VQNILQVEDIPTCHWLQKRNIYHGSVLYSNENQPWHHKFGLQKDNLYQKLFLTPTPALSMQSSTLFSFLTLEVDHETDTEVSFPTRSMIPNAKLGFYVLDEVSKENKWKVKFCRKLHHPLQI